MYNCMILISCFVVDLGGLSGWTIRRKRVMESDERLNLLLKQKEDGKWTNAWINGNKLVNSNNFKLILQYHFSNDNA